MYSGKLNLDVVPEEVVHAVDRSLKRFVNQPDSKEYEFPSVFDALERAYLHHKAKEFGLKSKSRGKGLNRFVTVYKRDGSTIIQADAAIPLVRPSRQSIITLLSTYPVTNKERQDLLPITERDRSFPPEASLRETTKSRLLNGIPIVPPPAVNSELLPFRKSLPIWLMRDAIMQAINSHSVVIISGETGCGKTTQVPQFIMDHSEKAGRGCRVICSMPRRISAVTVSERVALERAEPLGKTVGYQIRLESRVSPHTVLTYCTYGILLRTLLCGDSLLATVTHVIIDEIHERDRISDFMLIVLRDALAKYRGLKLVLMSTLDCTLFSKYFTNCPVISGNTCPIITVPGRLYEVQEFFLEDILKKTGYMTKEMAKVKKSLEKVRLNKLDLDVWTATVCANSGPAQQTSCFTATPILGKQALEVGQEKVELDGQLKQEMDRCIAVAWATGTEQAFTQLLQLILSENICVDYQHSETGLTALMAAAARGNADVTEHLLSLGAKVGIKCHFGDKTALHWAAENKHQDNLELLQAYMVYFENDPCKPEVEVELLEESKMLIDIYERSFDEEVDVDLIIHVLCYIHESGKKGAVLIFLPEYEYLVTVKAKILSHEKKLSEHGKISLFMLHEQMQTADQKLIFQPVAAGQRKVILSTNIAETSITIDDVAFVIDSGKVKERSFNALSNVYTVRCEWISQACARQRRGRAGRSQPGICFHLFSSIHYRAMQPHQASEILREPLQELCLHTKLLAPPNSPIADFLSRAIEPPSPLVTRNAVQLLKTMDAVDAWEDLTDLGRHLLEIPIEPRYGKMLVYSIILKCLDPVLTIVCCLSHGGLFTMPSKPGLKRNLASEQKKLANNCFSDHMVYLRVFQGWQQARYSNNEQYFCEKHFVSSASLELITGMRSHILSQLRANGLVKTRGAGDIRDVNSNSENWAVVKAALCGGLYPNLSRVDREHNVLRTQKEHKVLFHPSSTLREPSLSARVTPYTSHIAAVQSLPSDWLIFEEVTHVGQLSHIRTCTVVSAITIAVFAGPTRLPPDAIEDLTHPTMCRTTDSDSENETESVVEGQSAILRLDDWLVFRTDNEAALLTYQLRLKWHTLLLKRLKNINKPWTPGDEAVVNTLVSTLTSEEQALGLEQPQGVGQRPRPLNLDYFSHNRRSWEEYDGSEGRNLFLSTIENPGSRFDNQHRFSDATLNKPNQDQEGNVASGMNASPMTQNISNISTNDSNIRYFVIKAGNLKTVDASVNRGVWAFTHNTEKKILEAYKAGKTVILVFSLQSSGHFQGYARLRGDKCETSEPLPEQGGNLNCVLPVEWIKRGNISFNATRHLVNPYNENNKVQTSRDGQEVEPSVGEALCKMWDSPGTVWSNKNTIHQGGFPGRPIRGRPHYNSHYYRK